MRLKRVVRGQVVAEINSENGCKKLHQASLAGGPVERGRLFEKQLQLSLAELFSSAGPKPETPVCLLISGMASSTIGWKELPYARAPLPLDGSGLRTDLITWDAPRFVAKTVLISGVATETNMMRGEETEALGLLGGTKAPGDLILLLPGTHSKHLHLHAGVLHQIRTYLTGELYAILGKDSILAASVALNAGFSEEGFHSGVATAQKEGLAAGLFHTRTRQVLGGRAGAENAAFLSGLLIGSEVMDLFANGSPEILVGGARVLRDLYTKALAQLGSGKWRAFSDADCENAVARGQEIILSQCSGMNS